MSSARIGIAVVSVAALLAGCVRTHGLGSDGPGRDLPKGDLLKGDLLKGDLVKGDLSESDRRRSDLVKAPDLAKPESGSACAEPATINTGVPCGQQCFSASTDYDCDGIPNGRDPVATCNPLLSSEELSGYPPWTKWSPSGPVAWGCGAAALGVNGKLALVQSELAKITSGNLLVLRVFQY